MQNSLFEPDKYKTDWVMPHELPSLANASIIAIDTETKDNGIQEGKGPGWATGNGYVAGISIATDTMPGKYFPIRHERGPNLDPDTVLRWLKTELTRANQIKVGANILYDLGWLRHEGIEVTGPFYCTHTAEWLIDESRRANLGYLGEKYLGVGKTDELLYEYCADHFGGVAERKQAANIWRAPATIVGPYAESDVNLPLAIMPLQQKIMHDEGLEKVFDIEMRLLNMLVDMRMRGIRIDLDKAEKLRVELTSRLDRDQEKLDTYAGFNVNADAPTDIARLFDKLQLSYKTTAKSQEPSFTYTFLKNHDHEITDTILDVRKWSKFLSTFINGYIFGYGSSGRIHPEFSPTGARSGRFSSSNPNLQNVPARDEELGPLTRALFLPDENHELVGLDYSQIEFRDLVHLGVLVHCKVAIELAQRYIDDPTTDIHQFVAELLDVDRKPGKNLNFGIIYVMGIIMLAQQLNRSVADTKLLRAKYDKFFPFASQLSKKAMNTAQNRGYVKTLLGRRSRFNLWEPKNWDDKKGCTPLPRKKALEEWGQNKIQRAYTYTGLNRVIQGSAVDILKKAMVDIYESGVLDILGAPLLTVHDELIFSVPKTDEGKEAIQEVKKIMENCIKLSVPLKVDVATGNNWGELG